MTDKLCLPLYALAGVLLFSACSSDEPPPLPPPPAEQPTSINAHEKETQVGTKDLVVEYEKSYRRGAGVDGGGDKHFLDVEDGESPYLGRAKYDRLRLGERDESSTEILKRFKQGSLKDYSYYELSRWQRFCNQGQGMDRLDWRFIREAVQGKHVFPSELESTCKTPSTKLLKRNRVL